MARIKRDDSSWKARGIVRRDFRHSADGPEVAPHRGKRRHGGCYVHGHSMSEGHFTPPRLTITDETPEGWAHYNPGMRSQACSGCRWCIESPVACRSVRIEADDGAPRFVCSCGQERGRGRCPLDYSLEAREARGRAPARTGRIGHSRSWMDKPSTLVKLRADTPRELIRDMRTKRRR